MNNLDLTNFNELQTALQSLHPYNLIINFFNSFSFPKIELPGLTILLVSFIFTFLLMHIKKLKMVYSYLEFLMIVQYIAILHTIC